VVSELVVQELLAVMVEEGAVELLLVLLVEELGEAGTQGEDGRDGQDAREGPQKAPGSHAYQHP
jgi:hypothetical protein